MKFSWDNKYKAWGITAFITIVSAIIFFVILDRWETVWSFITLVSKSVAPITYGLILAYLLNPLMNIIEDNAVYPLLKKLFKNNKSRAKGYARGISIFLAWVIAALVIVALFALIIPELYKSIESLLVSIPQYSEHLIEQADRLLKKNPEIMTYIHKVLSGFSTDFTEIVNGFKGWIPNINVMLTGLTDSVSAVISAVFNMLIGVIVSVYILKDKEKFVAQFKRIFYSIMSYKNANRTVYFWRLTHDKFGNFIIGKIFDSLIIGLLCFIILTLVNMPYTALVSVIIGVTNVIPFFGPFIGAIPSAFLILLADPMKCLYFVIIIILLQQFDGNILGPKILGDTTGISSFWVMFAILVGSGLFGVWGMVCSVPVCAVVFALVNESCHNALRRKGIDYSCEAYEKLLYIDETTKAPKWFRKK